jgi:hypothetical protein
LAQNHTAGPTAHCPDGPSTQAPRPRVRTSARLCPASGSRPEPAQRPSSRKDPTGDHMKNLRLPLLLAVLLTLMPVLSTISTPAPVSAKTQIENGSGDEMDGDPESYSDGAPKGILAGNKNSTEAQTPDALWTTLVLWLKTAILRISNGF